MKKIILLTILFSTEILRLHAQKLEWLIAVLEEGQNVPTLKEYRCHKDTIGNKMVYYHIHHGGNYKGENYQRLDTTTSYGCKFADKKIYVYDFKKEEETLAFDFNLSVGDHFTTFNGMEWEVETVKDTLFQTPDYENGLSHETVPKRLLNVRTLDGKWMDHWIEDYGSLTNHLMILNLERVKSSQLLQVIINGRYYIREFNADPFYTHYSGWLDGNYGDSEDKTPDSKCYFENGNVVFEDFQWWWAHHEYNCFYRDGDNIYNVYSEELPPHVDGGESAWRKNVTTFKGLPDPASGNYTIHVGNKTYTTTTPTGIGNANAPFRATRRTYDLQGRPVRENTQRGILIKDGRKVWRK